MFSFGRLNDPSWARQSQFLQRMHEKYHKQGLLIFMVALDGPKQAAIKKFVKQHKLTLPVGYDAGNKAPALYRISDSPTLLVTDGEKKVTFNLVGFQEKDAEQAASAIRTVAEKERPSTG